MERLSEEEIAAQLGEVAWERDGETIVLDRRFSDFAGAMAFANRVAEVAEEANHHPDVLVHGWNKVRLTLYTHTVEGLTSADFTLARKIDELG